MSSRCSRKLISPAAIGRSVNVRNVRNEFAPFARGSSRAGREFQVIGRPRTTQIAKSSRRTGSRARLSSTCSRHETSGLLARSNSFVCLFVHGLNDAENARGYSTFPAEFYSPRKRSDASQFLNGTVPVRDTYHCINGTMTKLKSSESRRSILEISKNTFKM